MAAEKKILESKQTHGTVSGRLLRCIWGPVGAVQRCCMYLIQGPGLLYVSDPGSEGPGLLHVSDPVLLHMSEPVLLHVSDPGSRVAACV
eukprot:1024123-Pelagomonas_calceolata.AAC.1